MTYGRYQEHFAREVARAEADPELAATDEHARYLALHAHRTARIEKTYTVGDEMRSLLDSLTSPQVWMVITEPWCGDSAQSLPYIAKIAAGNPLIEFRLFLRDRNPDIMDRYLTRGTRSIPKLVAFDESGQELFRWGPRPREAMDLFLKARQAGTPREDISEELHLWYGRNRGRALESELLQLLKNVKGGEARHAGPLH
jgi:hypothetical protein